MLRQSPDELIRLEREEYNKALAESKVKAEVKGTDELDMRAVFVHGDLVISDSEKDGGFDIACSKFEDWVKTEFPRK